MKQHLPDSETLPNGFVFSCCWNYFSFPYTDGRGEAQAKEKKADYSDYVISYKLFVLWPGFVNFISAVRKSHRIQCFILL